MLSVCLALLYITKQILEKQGSVYSMCKIRRIRHYQPFWGAPGRAGDIIQRMVNFFCGGLPRVSHQMLGAKYNQQGQTQITTISAC